MINYAWFNNLNNLDIEKIESDLAIYTNEWLYTCLDFSTFTKQNVEVIADFDNVSTSVKISPSQIFFELDLPLEIDLPNGGKIEMDNFKVEILSNYGDMISVAESFGDGQLRFDEIASIKYFSVVFPYNEVITVYSLTDEESPAHEVPLTFMFAVMSDFTTGKPLKLDFISNQVGRINHCGGQIMIH
eukprot:GHVR01153212.1.p1 GENE.GHVR01153212.1~~GHVR01153212.1.p1  ORF type:complete len:187 (-),score=21.66 GHVR01153212.1:533-1093(-)